jgi:hypothetical protein
MAIPPWWCHGTDIVCIEVKKISQINIVKKAEQRRLAQQLPSESFPFFYSPLV